MYPCGYSVPITTSCLRFCWDSCLMGVSCEGSLALLSTALPCGLHRGRSSHWEKLLVRWTSHNSQKLELSIAQGTSATSKPHGPSTSLQTFWPFSFPSVSCVQMWKMKHDNEWEEGRNLGVREGEILEWVFMSIQWNSMSKSLAT